MKILSIYFWRNLKLNMRDFFFPRQKWLTRNVPPHWCDKVELIPIVLFEILIHFVEEEMDNVSWDWQDEVDAGHTSQEHADRVKKAASELRSAYDYVKNMRSNLQKQLNDSYPPYPLPDKLLGIKYEDLYAETNFLEKMIESQDEWAMQIIIKNRQFLWT